MEANEQGHNFLAANIVKNKELNGKKHLFAFIL